MSGHVPARFCGKGFEEIPALKKAAGKGAILLAHLILGAIKNIRPLRRAASPFVLIGAGGRRDALTCGASARSPAGQARAG